jgi:predicted tellurium resistance membrane protein TerC
MSLDNVLAVAGAAQDRLWVLVAGLLLSVGLMGLAAGLVARLLERHRWIAWVGFVIVLYVALTMIWRGGHEVAGAIGPWPAAHWPSLHGPELHFPNWHFPNWHWPGGH